MLGNKLEAQGGEGCERQQGEPEQGGRRILSL